MKHKRYRLLVPRSADREALRKMDWKSTPILSDPNLKFGIFIPMIKGSKHVPYLNITLK